MSNRSAASRRSSMRQSCRGAETRPPAARRERSWVALRYTSGRAEAQADDVAPILENPPKRRCDQEAMSHSAEHAEGRYVNDVVLHDRSRPIGAKPGLMPPERVGARPPNGGEGPARTAPSQPRA